MSYETKSLGWALKQIHPSHPQFFIPAMQRPYVWKQDNLIALFESIYQGFPIGTSLIWRTKYDNPKDLGAGRVFWIAKQYSRDMQPKQAHLDQDEPITLILDGQQRLTSLNIGTRGEWYKNGKKWKLCFDPNYADKGSFNFFDFTNPHTGHLITCEKILRWENRDVFDQDIKRYLFQHPKSQGDGPDNREQNFLTLRQRFWEVDAYCYGVYQAESMQDALQAFLLANDTGKPLERTDLISALLQISWDNYSAREVIADLVTELNKKFLPKSGPFDRKKILNIFLISAPSNINAQYRVKEFSKEIIQELENYWPTFKRVMVAVVAQLKRWGLTNNGCMSSANALIPLVRWVVNNKLDFATENKATLVEIEKARKWFISALFSSAFSGNSAKTINAARKIVDDSEGSSFPFTALHAEMDSHHSHDLISVAGVVRFIKGLSYNDGGSNLRLVLMLIKKNLNSDYKYELDHILSKAQHEERYPVTVHSIANLQLLTKEENSQKSNQTPARLWNQDAFDGDWRENNQLPRDKQVENATAIYDDPERFWQQRRDLIAELVCDALEVQKL